MSDIALRPRSATELVDAAFQLYRRQPLQFIVGLGLIYVPWMLLLASLGLQGRMQTAGTGQPNMDAPTALLVTVWAASSSTCSPVASRRCRERRLFRREGDVGCVQPLGEFVPPADALASSRRHRHGILPSFRGCIFARLLPSNR